MQSCAKGSPFHRPLHKGGAARVPPTRPRPLSGGHTAPLEREEQNHDRYQHRADCNGSAPPAGRPTAMDGAGPDLAARFLGCGWCVSGYGYLLGDRSQLPRAYSAGRWSPESPDVKVAPTQRVIPEVAPCRGARLNPTQRYFHPLPLYIDFVFLKKIIFIYI